MKKLLSALIEVALTDRQREVVDLYYVKGKSQVEIAELLGVSRQNISKTIILAKRKLEKSKKYF